MNIVSNCCAGGFLYKTLGLPYTNPFIWCAITSTDYIKLMNEFNLINYANITIEPSHIPVESSRLHPTDTVYCVVLENGVRLHYTHYKYSPTDDIPRVYGIDVRYKQPYDYVLNKYRSRTKRMVADGHQPVCLICDNKVGLEWSYTDFVRLNEHLKYKCVVFSSKDLSNVQLNPNILWINESGYEHDTMVTKYLQTILEFYHD